MSLALLDLARDLDKVKAEYEVIVGDWDVRQPGGQPSKTTNGRRNTAMVKRFAVQRGLVEPLKPNHRVPTMAGTIGNMCVMSDGNKVLFLFTTALSISGLVALNLSGCDIDAEGAIALASILVSSALTSLDLNDNGIGHVGAASIAPVLADCPLTDRSAALRHWH